MFLLSLLTLPFPLARSTPSRDAAPQLIPTHCNGLQGNTDSRSSQCCPISRKLLGALSFVVWCQDEKSNLSTCGGGWLVLTDSAFFPLVGQTCEQGLAFRRSNHYFSSSFCSSVLFRAPPLFPFRKH